MVKVQYIGSRSCKADGVAWIKYEIKEVTKDFYDRYKNQGFKLVIKKNVVRKEIVKIDKFVDEDKTNKIGD